MKKSLLLTMFIVLSLFASAQFTKGQKVLSGSVSFATYKNAYPPTNTTLNNVDQKSFSFSPSFAWFKNATTLNGLKLIFNTNKYTDEVTPSYNNKNTSIALGYFIQKIKPLGKDFFLFAETGINANYSWSDYNSSVSGVYNSKGESYGASVYVTPGLGYKISPSFIVDITLNNIASINYGHGKNDYATTPTGTRSTQKTDMFTVATGLEKNALGNIGIGIRWLLK